MLSVFNQPAQTSVVMSNWYDISTGCRNHDGHSFCTLLNMSVLLTTSNLMDHVWNFEQTGQPTLFLVKNCPSISGKNGLKPTYFSPSLTPESQWLSNQKIQLSYSILLLKKLKRSMHRLPDCALGSLSATLPTNACEEFQRAKMVTEGFLSIHLLLTAGFRRSSL